MIKQPSFEKEKYTMALTECSKQVYASGREITCHGTPSFPMACYEENFRIMDVPWHWHDEMETGIITQGHINFTINTVTYALQQGDVFFVNAGVLHAARALCAQPCELHSIVFHPKLLSSGIDSIYWKKYIQPLVMNSSLKGLALQDTIVWQKEASLHVKKAWAACVTEPGGYEFIVRNELSLFLYAIISHTAEAVQKTSPKAIRDNARIKIMLKFLEVHLHDPVSISQISDSADISESECLRCFRATIGVSPIKYLKTLRLQKAAELLSSTDLSISTIGGQCGFQDMSYFSKEFSQYTGHTPSAYRAQHSV
jgi:AraC-like DNA-binding protein/mannose-6-phosphate isomerase-like protein (cupin superfamily)